MRRTTLRRACLVAAVAVAVGLWAPSTEPASAAGFAKWERFDRVSGLLVGDGRLLVYGTGPGRLRVLDTVSGRRRAVRLARSCPSTLIGLSGGLMLFECGPRHFRVVSARTGRRIAAPGLEALRRERLACGDECSALGLAFGRHWVDLEWWRPGDATRGFLNWRTGATSFGSRSATDIDDLDAPGLVRPLCAPLARTPVAGATDLPFFQQLIVRSGVAAGHGPDGNVRLHRCGTRRSIRLPGPALREALPHAVGAIGAPLRGHNVLTAVVPRTGRRRAWSLRRFAGRYPALVAMTNTHVFAARSGVRRTVLYRARLP